MAVLTKLKNVIIRILIGLAKLVASLALLAVIGAGMPYSILILIIAPIAYIVFAPTDKRKFLKLERILPTSKIRSMAMGLVELDGRVKSRKITTPKMPLKQGKCIGYYYTVEDRYTHDGKISYKKVHSEMVISPFVLKGKTGEVHVDADSLKMVGFPLQQEVIKNGQRYRQYVLFSHQKIKLIGHAKREGSRVIVTKDTHQNIFSITPVQALNEHYELQPLMRSLLYHSVFVVIMIAVILMLDIQFVDGDIQVSVEWFSF